MGTIACGDYHGIAIGTDDKVWTWGANNYCETGHPENAGANNATVTAPQVVKSLEGKTITYIRGGSHHTAAVDDKGTAFIWGRVDGFQTGIPLKDLKAIEE